MESPNLVGVVEFNDKKIKCVIFNINYENKLEIISTAEKDSDGIRDDIITNISKASGAIRACISSAESKAKISLKKINVVFEQRDFLCTNFSKHKKIDGAKIHQDDIEFLLKEAKKQLILNDKNQSIIHIFNHNYIVDNKEFNEEPIGIYADHLTHEVTFITIPQNNLKNIKQVFIDCDLEIERFFSRTFVLGAELLTYKELQGGSVLIDIVAEKISLGLFKKLVLINSYTIPVGINHILKDISKVCSLDLNESGKIIKNIDFSFEDNSDVFDKSNYLNKDFFISSNYRKISKDLIINVIKARLDEILDIFKKQLLMSGFDIKLGLNFLIKEENIKLSNLENYFITYFGNKLLEANIKKFKNEDDINSNFAACLGAIKIIKDGWETEAIPQISSKNSKKIGFFSKIFGNSL